MMVIVTSAVLERGMIIRRNLFQYPNPSMIADSSSSTGRVLKNCRRKKVPYAVKELVRIRDQRLLSNPNFFKTMKLG
jgi:hypothetical protein